MRRNLRDLVRRCGVVAVLMLFCLISKAQDPHYTDFRMAPMFLNPALTGAFEGTYRISGIYRSQWGPIGNSKAYKNPFASVDGNLIGGLLSKHDWVSLGVSFLRGTEGTLDYGVGVSGLNLGYHIGSDKDYKNVFSVGLNYGGLNGTVKLANSVTSLGTRATLPGGQTQDGKTQAESGNTISLGVAYKTRLENDAVIRIGLNAANLNNPTANFLNRGSGTGTNNQDSVNQLGRRMVLHGESSFLLNDKLRLNPAAFIAFQGTAQQFNIQSTVDYDVNPEKRTSVSLGLGFRTSDALLLIGGIQIKDLKVHLAYDITTSSLKTAGGNTFELSVGYIGRIFKQPQIKPVIFCPRL